MILPPPVTGPPAEVVGLSSKVRPLLPCLVICLFLALPNLAAAIVSESPVWGLRIWLSGALSTFIPLIITRRRLAFSRWLLAPLVFIVPSMVLVTLFTRTVPSSTLMGIIAEADGEECSRYGLEIAASCVLGALSVWLCHRICRFNGAKDDSLNLRAAAILAVALASPLAIIGAVEWVGLGRGTACWHAVNAFRAAYPLGTFSQFVDAVSSKSMEAQRQHDLNSLQVTASARPLPPHAREIYVLVIGESARYASFQINGYARPTTPVLASTEDLLSFANVASQATTTSQSVPLLLTGTSAGDAAHLASAPSLLQVFKSAGFKVCWLSTQQKHGTIEIASSVYARQADESEFVAHTIRSAVNADGYGEPDGALLPMLARVLDGGAPRVLVVLHTMGSHWWYPHRYPSEFEKFPARIKRGELISAFSGDPSRAAFTNAYDNTLCYTDWLLGRVIDTLKQQPCAALMWYVSDHGENTAYTERFPCAHGMVTEDVVHVPMLVWASEAFKHSNAPAWEALQSRRTAPVSSQCIFHSLADAAGITSPLVRPSASIASARYQGSARLVLAMDDTVHDFDAESKPKPSDSLPLDILHTSAMPAMKALSSRSPSQRPPQTTLPQ